MRFAGAKVVAVGLVTVMLTVPRLLALRLFVTETLKP